jgi:hypothetical protein
MRWQVVNYEEPGNEHYADEYDIAAPTVVIVKMEGGEEIGWENLMRVWEFVNDKDAFLDYVQTEARALSEGSS